MNVYIATDKDYFKVLPPIIKKEFDLTSETAQNVVTHDIYGLKNRILSKHKGKIRHELHEFAQKNDFVAWIFFSVYKGFKRFNMSFYVKFCVFFNETSFKRSKIGIYPCNKVQKN